MPARGLPWLLTKHGPSAQLLCSRRTKNARPYDNHIDLVDNLWLHDEAFVYKFNEKRASLPPLSLLSLLSLKSLLPPQNKPTTTTTT